METVIERLRAALLIESESVEFTHEDADYYHFRISDSEPGSFNGAARVEKESYESEYQVDFKSESSESYRDGGMIKV